MNKPNLLILDEATNALDQKTELEICHSVAAMKNDMTILSISHREIWLDYADEILTVEDFGVAIEHPKQLAIAQ